MAKIIKRDDSLKKEYNRLIKREKRNFMVFAILLPVSLILIAIFSLITVDQNYYTAPIFLFIISIVFLFKGVFKTDDIEILEAGIDGENATAKILNQLPDNYMCFMNVLVTYSGKSEIDTVVVGPSGVFVIEIKNIKGKILADVKNKKWLQKKITGGGKLYQKFFYNPIMQVRTHAYRLNGFLKENGIKTYINPIVYFANEDASVNIEHTSEIPVFSFSKNGDIFLKEYILNNKQRLSGEKIKAICRLL